MSSEARSNGMDSFLLAGGYACVNARAGLVTVLHDQPILLKGVRYSNEQVVAFYERLGYEDAEVTVLSRWLNNQAEDKAQ
jgi:ribosomal protein S18 acetylase RimI-like enzyme